jgi:hypothetical protein
MWRWLIGSPGIANATDDALRAASAVDERRGTASALGVFAGLLLEVGLAWTHPTYDSVVGRWGSVIADALVALGVFGELLFSNRAQLRQHELDRRSREKVASAQLELETLRASYAPRALTRKQCEALQTLKGQVAAVCVTSSATTEAVQFAYQIGLALHAVGIVTRPGAPRAGLVWTEIYLVTPGPSEKDSATEPLMEAFRLAGLTVVGCKSRMTIPMPDLPRHIPVIMVGEKLNPHSASPYAETLQTLLKRQSEIAKA